jgi:RNA polymerase sigma-70 factor (ECF subfamily)
MEVNEKLLIDKAKAGDIQSFEMLVEKHQKRIFNIALRVIGNHADAADLAQNALIRIYKSIGNFKEESSLSTWIYRITMNVCFDELRRRKNRKLISIEQEIQLDDGDVKRQLESESPQPSEAAEKKELKSIVRNAIEQLSDEHKEVIILRDLQAFSYDEIASILDLPVGTVKSRINRARSALKKILTENKELLSEYYVKQLRKED